MGPCVSQEVPSFGNSLSRCPCQVAHCVCVIVNLVLFGPCASQGVPSFGSSLSRCPIFYQVAHYVCVCDRESCVLLGPCASQDVPSFGSSLSRCLVPSLAHCVCVCVCVIVRLVCNWVLVLVRMSHPSAAARSDVPLRSIKDWVHGF